MKILALDVPALHLGYLGCYGNDWVATPNIDRLACDSIVFERHYFDVEQPPLPPALRTILDQLHLNYAAIECRSHNSLENMQEVVAKTLALDWPGLSFVTVHFPSLAPPWNMPPELLDSYCEEEDEPWLKPPQGPLENPDDLPRLQNTFAAVVTHIDAHVGALFDGLREQGVLDEMHVWVTSSGGLPLGEHGFVGFHRPWPHEEFVHLPLLLRLPQGERAGLRLNALTQPVDLFATFLKMLGGSEPLGHGHDLWPLIRGDVKQVRAHACTALRLGDEEEWALRTLDWALMLPIQNSSRSPRLFVKPDDRWEVNDVRQHHLELAEEMEKVLRDLSFRARSEHTGTK
jgi:arylsulfatase A-like enzyme